MAQSKRFRAKRTLTPDCGHSVKAGERTIKLYPPGKTSRPCFDSHQRKKP